MTERQKLNDTEIQQLGSSLPGWSVQNGKLHREFKFKDFAGAWSFMSGVALVAESLNHHPNWSNVYNRVVIDLMTHDLGGLSTLDVEFARRVSALGK